MAEALLYIVLTGKVDPEWLTAVGTLALASATLVLALVAVFQDRIRSWLSRPSLEMTVRTGPPDCVKIPLTYSMTDRRQQTDCYYFRVLVTNTGNEAAQMVEVFVAGVHKQDDTGSFQPLKSFLPLNLTWANYGQPFFPRISRGLPKHCDVAHIVHPASRRYLAAEDNRRLGVGPNQTLLSLDLIVKPNTLSHLLSAATYRVDLIVGAPNAASKTRCLEIVHSGQWFDDEDRMLREGVRLRFV